MKFSFAGLILLIGLFTTANLATAKSIETGEITSTRIDNNTQKRFFCDRFKNKKATKRSTVKIEGLNTSTIQEMSVSEQDAIEVAGGRPGKGSRGSGGPC